MSGRGWRIVAIIGAITALASGCTATNTVTAADGVANQGSEPSAETQEPAAVTAPTTGTAEPSPTQPATTESPTAGAVPADAIEGPDLEARGLAVVEAGPAAVPPAFSTIAQVGELGFYYQASDGQMSLIAFDADTVVPSYRIAASPLGRIRGVGQEVLVDGEQGLIFVTGYDESIGGEEGGYVAGHDAVTGAELWRTSIPYYSAQPFDCGLELCVRSNGEQRWVDKASGALVDFARVSDRRVLHSSEALTVTTSASLRSGEFAGITGAGDYGRDTNWEITAEQFNDAVGAAVDPSFGWRSQFIQDANVVIVHLARSDSDGWGSAGIDSRTGQVLWSREGIAPCLDMPLGDGPAIVCPTGDDPFLATAVQRINPRNGDATWTVEVEAGASVEVIYDGTKLIVWTFDDTDTTNGTNYEIDVVSGERTQGPTTAVCGYQLEWHDFEYPDGDVLDFASSALLSMCSSDGYLLYPDEVITLAPKLGIEPDTPLWLVDFDGAPISSAG